MAKAISYIMSVMLMTAVIAGLSFAMLVWAMGELSSLQDLITGAIDARIEKAKERFVIEHVSFGISDSQVVNATVTVRNVGEIEIKIDSIYVNHTLYRPSSPVTIMPGGFADITVTFDTPLPLVSGYDVTVPTVRGNKVSGEFSP